MESFRGMYPVRSVQIHHARVHHHGHCFLLRNELDCTNLCACRVSSTFRLRNITKIDQLCSGGALRALSASIVSIIFLWRTYAIWHKSRVRRLPFLVGLLLNRISAGPIFLDGLLHSNHNFHVGLCLQPGPRGWQQRELWGACGNGRIRGEVAVCTGITPVHSFPPSHSDISFPQANMVCSRSVGKQFVR